MSIPAAGQVAELRRASSIRQGALITGMCVAVGAAVAAWTLPPAPTPTNITRTFLEARLASDSATAWDLLCRSVRYALGDENTLAENWARADELHVMPSDATVSIGDVEARKGFDGPFAAVAFTLSSEQGGTEDWHDAAYLFLVPEDGGFRVCNHAPLTGFV